MAQTGLVNSKRKGREKVRRKTRAASWRETMEDSQPNWDWRKGGIGIGIGDDDAGAGADLSTDEGDVGGWVRRYCSFLAMTLAVSAMRRPRCMFATQDIIVQCVLGMDVLCVRLGGRHDKQHRIGASHDGDGPKQPPPSAGQDPITNHPAYYRSCLPVCQPYRESHALTVRAERAERDTYDRAEAVPSYRFPSLFWGPYLSNQLLFHISPLHPAGYSRGQEMGPTSAQVATPNAGPEEAKTPQKKRIAMSPGILFSQPSVPCEAQTHSETRECTF